MRLKSEPHVLLFECWRHYSFTKANLETLELPYLNQLKLNVLQFPLYVLLPLVYNLLLRLDKLNALVQTLRSFSK